MRKWLFLAVCLFFAFTAIANAEPTVLATAEGNIDAENIEASTQVIFGEAIEMAKQHWCAKKAEREGRKLAVGAKLKFGEGKLFVELSSDQCQ